MILDYDRIRKLLGADEVVPVPKTAGPFEQLLLLDYVVRRQRQRRARAAS